MVVRVKERACGRPSADCFIELTMNPRASARETEKCSIEF